MELKAQKRDLKESLKTIRKAGNIPAVFYGHKTESTPITINAVRFNKIYEEAGKSTIFELDLNGEKIDVMVKSVDYDPVKDTVIHVDFYVPTKGQEMEAEIPLEFIGTPIAEKAGNIINKILLSVKVKTLPKNLPENIEVNIEKLENIGDSISLGDLELPEGVILIDDLSEIVINVTAPKTIEEEDNSNADELEIPKEEETENKE